MRLKSFPYKVLWSEAPLRTHDISLPAASHFLCRHFVASFFLTPSVHRRQEVGCGEQKSSDVSGRARQLKLSFPEKLREEYKRQLVFFFFFQFVIFSFVFIYILGYIASSQASFLSFLFECVFLLFVFMTSLIFFLYLKEQSAKFRAIKGTCQLVFHSFYQHLFFIQTF